MAGSLFDTTDDFKFGSFKGLLFATATFFSLASLFYLSKAVYNVFFHPLSHFPGPKLAASSRLLYARKLLKGEMVQWLHTLHQQYGEVVRIAPDELSFISGETAWQDIYGFHTGEKAQNGKFLKDRNYFAKPYNGTWSIIQSDAETHNRMRRVLAHAFSDKALREQEDLIQGYVELFIQRLHEQVENENKGKIDLVRWYNYFTFDVIADLTFGEAFHCLRDSDYHPWVQMVFASVKAITVKNIVQRYPLLDKAMAYLAPKDLLAKREKFFRFSVDSVGRRLATETARPDFMTYILKHEGPKGLSRDEMDSNAQILLVAGSETTATLLSGCTYLLLTNPEKLKKVVEEVRGKFKSASEITIEAVSHMPYLLAVLSESLRAYPPVPAGFNRIVPGKGDFISGHWVPGGTSVAMSQWPANHSERNFVEPNSFIPERFLEGEGFEKDKKSVLNAFSFGPRNCLGKNLAYAEMRLILARLLFDFDLELVDPSLNWLDQKVFLLWEKPDLMVKLKPVRSYIGA